LAHDTGGHLGGCAACAVSGDVRWQERAALRHGFSAPGRPVGAHHWAITAFALWVAAHVFKGLRFDGGGALLVAALLLGLANAVVRPLLVVLTLPLTLLSFGLFLLVINALVLMLVARLVNGFHLDGFWTAFWASIFMSLLSLMLGLVLGGTPEFTIETSPGPGQTWL